MSFASDVVTCPFNKLHVMPSSSLQKHIIKCMKNYPNHEVCPYNALHRFLDKEDYLRHILICPNKTHSFNTTLKGAHGDLTTKHVHVGNNHEFSSGFESWDR